VGLNFYIIILITLEHAVTIARERQSSRNYEKLIQSSLPTPA